MAFEISKASWLVESGMAELGLVRSISSSVFFLQWKKSLRTAVISGCWHGYFCIFWKQCEESVTSSDCSANIQKLEHRDFVGQKWFSVLQSLNDFLLNWVTSTETELMGTLTASHAYY